MNRMIAAAALLGSVLATPAMALDPKIDAAVKTFDAVANDPAKVKAYCDMSRTMQEVGEDEKKLEAANDKLDEYFKTLGPDFETAWNSGDNLSEDSEEAKALSAALDKLDNSCGDSTPPPADGAAEK